MDHSVPQIDLVARPWRTATLVASAVAALELVVIVAAGVAFFGKAVSHDVTRAAVHHVFAPVKAAAPAPQPGRLAPLLARADTSVIVLNGNGRAGAASLAAARVRALGYVIGGTGNAPRRVLKTAVMYRPGFDREARRLAHDLGIRVSGPLDGLRPADLMGAHLALVLGP